MELPPWLVQNWFSLLQSIGILAGLLFNAMALRADTKSRRATNLITFTAHHRELWSRFAGDPGLARVLDPNADLEGRPLTQAEELFTRDLILHLNSAFHAMDEGLLIAMEGLPGDVRGFFSLPIPQAVWDGLRPLQDREFVRFVESLLAG